MKSSVIMLQGSDTTAVAISWTFLMMAIYPDIQEKAYRELVDIFGDSDRPCEMEDANCMKYTEMVIKESLRHYTIPVSYTHLDVYKRQILCLCL